MKGTYILTIALSEPQEIVVGALGSIAFKRGYYFYVGSAMASRGSTTLLNRVKRHVSASHMKKIHWHIDYLLSNELCIIQRIFLIPSKDRLECLMAKELLDYADGFIKKFGCSDCACNSHLIYFKTPDKFPAFT